MSLLFNKLSRFVIAILPRSKCLLISWLQSSSTLISEPRKMKSDTVSTFSPSICHEVMGPDAIILVFWMLSFKPAFSLSSFTFVRGSFVPLHFLPLKWYHLHIWGCWYFSWRSWFQLVIHSAYCYFLVCAVLGLVMSNPMGCSLPGSSVHGDSPGKNTGVSCHVLFQEIFPTQGSSPGLPLCRQILYHLNHQGSPRILEWVTYPFPGDLPNPRIKPGSPALQEDSSPTREAHFLV